MPRPDVCSTPDWPAVFARGTDYETWLGRAESDEQRERLATSQAEFTLDPTIAAGVQALTRPVQVLAIAEAWCPDVHRHLPVLQRLLALREDNQLALVHRADVAEILPRYLTCGGEAVPKFIFFTDDHIECGTWGPMPTDCHRLIVRGRACRDQKTARALVSLRYQADPERLEAQRELFEHMWVAATVGLSEPVGAWW